MRAGITLFRRAASAAVSGAKLLAAGHVTYSLGLWVAAGVVDRLRAPPIGSTNAEPLSIAALVVAHDEERVIADLVESLLSQRYPRERFGVFVVADNCSDRTADRAREKGASVFERRTGATEGKPAALVFGLRAILEQQRFDAVAVFDADNLVDTEFLAEINRRFSLGERVVQGFVDAKNPDGSWVAASSAVGFWAIAALEQQPRETLGLSAPLMGTGWAATTEVAAREIVALDSLTDDYELGAVLATHGIRVAYEPRARVLDEKPWRLSHAIRQRERWMRGRFSVVERRLGSLVAATFGAGELGFAARLRAADVALRIISPSLLFSSTALGMLAVSELALAGFIPRRVLSARASLGLAALGFVAPALAIGRFAPPRLAWLSYLLQPGYLLMSVPLGLSGLLRKQRRDWQRTAHGSGA